MVYGRDGACGMPSIPMCSVVAVISYAQNLEDVVLSRLTAFVPVGSYVDVGAAHPVLENVTYWLYTHGWRGVNVEPMAREVELLRAARPLDVTVEAAVGASRGAITLYEAPLENRGSTTADSTLAERYRSEGQDFRAFDVELRTLDDVLDEHPLSPLHIVKIDVEGAESDVLAGFDLHRHRPWVLVVEATVPNSRRRSSMEWETAVLAAGYVHTLFDGLNCFYVRDDLPDVVEALSVPANVFDRWAPAELQRVRDEVQSAQERAAELERRLADATRYAASLEDAVKRAETHAFALEGAAQDWAAERTALIAALGEARAQRDARVDELD